MQGFTIRSFSFLFALFTYPSIIHPVLSFPRTYDESIQSVWTHLFPQHYDDTSVDVTDINNLPPGVTIDDVSPYGYVPTRGISILFLILFGSSTGARTSFALPASSS